MKIGKVFLKLEKEKERKKKRKRKRKKAKEAHLWLVVPYFALVNYYTRLDGVFSKLVTND